MSYRFGEVVRKSDTNVLIKSESVIPIEIIESSKSTLDIFLANIPFILTVFIVISAAVVTYRSNRKSVESQNLLSQKSLDEQSKLAEKSKNAEHENKISEFRHRWLQEVRDTAAGLIKIIHECQFFTMERNDATHRLKDASDLEKEIIKNELNEAQSKLVYKRMEFYKYHAKLCLMFKKDEPETKDLFEKLTAVKTSMGDLNSRSLDDSVINEITEQLQVILKSEWEATKDRSWLSNT
jgi:hypothetical protein